MYSKLENSRQPRVWWVVFRDAAEGPERRLWWRRLTRPGFRHCYCFTQMTPGQVLLIDPLVDRAEHVLTIALPADLVFAALGQGQTVVVVREPPRAYDARLFGRGLLKTCAGFVGYTVGMGAEHVTPYQLYKALIARGGRELSADEYPRHITTAGA